MNLPGRQAADPSLCHFCKGRAQATLTESLRLQSCHDGTAVAKGLERQFAAGGVVTDSAYEKPQDDMAADEQKKAASCVEPQRTCVGCRAVMGKSALLRYVLHDGALTPDPAGILSGRGAYLCRNEACLKEALKKKDVFSRALRARVIAPDVKELLAELTVSRAG